MKKKPKKVGDLMMGSSTSVPVYASMEEAAQASLEEALAMNVSPSSVMNVSDGGHSTGEWPQTKTPEGSNLVKSKEEPSSVPSRDS